VKSKTSTFQEGRCSSEFVPYLLTLKSPAVTICTTMLDVQISISLPLECASVLYGSQNKQHLLPFSATFDRFLGAFAKLRKGTINFVRFFYPSVRPSILMQQHVSHWTDFKEISFLRIFRKSVEKIQVLLKYDKNNEDFT
jgi:hypothetical protein